jgi:N-acetylneuraminic acid mutarotase
MPTARGWFSTSVVNNNIYAVGGAIEIGSDLDAFEVFDPNTNTWSVKASLPTPRGFLSTCAVDGIIYTIGGGWATVCYSTVEAYDPITETWTTKSPMLTARAGLSACEVGGIIYAIGGFIDNTGTGITTVEAYNPQTNQWTTKASMPTPRMGFSTSAVDGIIYAFGGLSYRGSPSLSNVEAYDPATDIWTTKTDLPIPLSGLSTCVVDGIIYAFGGVQYGGGPCYPIFKTYDPVTDTWTTMPNMPYGVGFHSNSIVDGKIYLVGGVNTARTPLDIVYEYNPSIVPVELVSFTGNNVNGKVLLEWKTATELNNNGFEVQRKTAESEFATVGFVKGHGTTTNQKEYSYTDKNLADGKYFYRLKQIDYNGSYEYSNVIEVDVRSLDKFTLEQNYPNPFNPTTIIGYVIQEKSNAKLTLFNSIGEEIAVLVNKEQDKGYHKVEFDAAALSSGVYFYRIQAGSFTATKKLLLLK